MFSDATVEAVQVALPDWLALLFAGVTLLGDPWLAIPILALTYWYGVRERALPLFAAAVGGLSVILLCKAVLGLPRPSVGPPVPVETAPEFARPVYEYTVHQDGFGLPSGHAATGILLWGTVALSLPGEWSRGRSLALATVAVLVAVSRVVLGVHYPVDVVGGLAVGVGALAVALLIIERTDRSTPLLFGGAGLAATLAVLAQGFGTEPLALFGGAVGALIAVAVLSPSPWSFGGSLRGVALGIGGLVLLGAAAAGATAVVAGIATVVGGSATAGISVLEAVAPTAALGFGIFAWPVLVDYLDVRLHSGTAS